MEWRNKINTLIRQTEVNLSQVDGRIVAPPSISSVPSVSSLSSPSSYNPPSSPSVVRDSKLNAINDHNYKKDDGLYPYPHSNSISNSHSQYNHNLTRESSPSPFLSSLSSSSFSPLSSAPTSSNTDSNQTLLEIQLLKQQFLVFKENAEKNSQAQRSVIVELRRQIDSDEQLVHRLKEDLLAQLKAELRNDLKNELRSELRNELRNQLVNELSELKQELKHGLRQELGSDFRLELKQDFKAELSSLQDRLREVEQGLESAGTLVVTHTSPLHTRMEQLSHTLHTSMGQLRSEINRLRSTMDSFLGNATQAQSLGSTVADMQQDLGGLKSMVMGWNASMGSLKNELEVLKVTVDRTGGMYGEIQALRNTVDRNAGWQAATRREQDMLRSTVEKMATTVSGSGINMDPMGHSPYVQRPSSRNTTPLPFTQDSQEFIRQLKKPTRPLKQDSFESYNTNPFKTLNTQFSDSSTDTNIKTKRLGSGKHKPKKERQRLATSGSERRQKIPSNSESDGETYQDDRKPVPSSSPLPPRKQEPAYSPTPSPPPSTKSLHKPDTAPTTKNWLHSSGDQSNSAVESQPPSEGGPTATFKNKPQLHNIGLTQNSFQNKSGSKSLADKPDTATYKTDTEFVYDKTDTENNTELVFDKTDTENNTELIFDKTDTENNTELIFDKTDTENNTELIFDKTDTENNTEMIFDKTDTENNTDAIYDKTDTENNTEAIFDKTDTEMHTGSEAFPDEPRTELVFDGSDTDATMDTDLSYNVTRSRVPTRSNVIAPHKLARHSSSSLSEANHPTDTKRASLDYTKNSSAIKGNAKDGLRSSLKGNKIGYETDDLGRTEDDFSFASFASFAESDNGNKSPANLSSGGEALRRSKLSIGQEENKTEDDFSLDSFAESEDDIPDEDKEANEFSDEDNESSSSYITAEPNADPTLEELPRFSKFKDDDAASDSSVRRSQNLFSKFMSKKVVKLDTADDDSSSADSDSSLSLMDSWDRVMGPSSIKLPSSLLKISRNSPISARKMYSSDEDTTPVATNALTKTGSFMTYEQFSKQFEGEQSEPENEEQKGANLRASPIHYEPSSRHQRASVESLESLHSDDDLYHGDQFDDDDHSPAISTSPPPLNLDGESSEGELSLNNSPPHQYEPGSVTRYNTSPPAKQLENKPNHEPNLVSPAPTPSATSTTNNERRKFKKSISTKIMALQKECGFFSRPPPTLHYAAGRDDEDGDDSHYNGNGAGEVKEEEAPHTPISSPTRNRPKGPNRRPPSRR